MHRLAADLGVSDTYHRTPVGVWFGEPGTRVPDPYFGGEGPDKVGCTGCGACMTGCRVGAKNTLDRNYLYLAERNGAVVHPDTQVVDLEATEGGGWLVHTDRSGAVLRHRRRTFVARERGLLRRRARHAQAAPAAQGGRAPAAGVGPARRCRAHQQRGHRRGRGPHAEARAAPRAWRSPRRSTPTTPPTSSRSATRRARTPWACSPRSSWTAAARSPASCASSAGSPATRWPSSGRCRCVGGRSGR